MSTLSHRISTTILFSLVAFNFYRVSEAERYTEGNIGPKGKNCVYGRISKTKYRLTDEQIQVFHRDGCVTLPNVLTAEEVDPLVKVFDRFTGGQIHVPGKDFCDMSQPFGTPYEDWQLVNCMLPTKYYPPLQGNIYERLTADIASQLFPNKKMKKDYDQLLNKRPGKDKAVFHWHQDMAYWPASKVLGVSSTETCTFSLALDDSDQENGCLRYVVGSGKTKTLRPHHPTSGKGREDGHALATDVFDSEEVRYAPAEKGSITIHDEYVIHGSSGNLSNNRQRRTYVVAYRAAEIVDAERRLGFTHSHNDHVNWDTFGDGENRG